MTRRRSLSPVYATRRTEVGGAPSLRYGRCRGGSETLFGGIVAEGVVEQLLLFGPVTELTERKEDGAAGGSERRGARECTNIPSASSASTDPVNIRYLAAVKSCRKTSRIAPEITISDCRMFCTTKTSMRQLSSSQTT
jgi:hypothetical protein